MNGWLAELKDSRDPSLRDAAVKVIPMFGPEARRPALEPLLAALNRERDPGVRMNVINLLGVIGAENAEQAKRISNALALALARTAPGAPSRLNLVRALATYGPDASSALPEVLSIITDPAWETRRAAAFALGRLGLPSDAKSGPNARAMQALVNTLLKDDSAAVRLEAVQSLILLGPPAYKDPSEYPALIKPYLTPVMDRQKVEKDKAVQIWLQVLVMRYDGTQLTDQNILKLAESISSTDPAARYHALTALGMLGPQAKPAVPQIAAALAFDEPDLVIAALATLATLGEHANQALPELHRFKGLVKDEGLKQVVDETIDVVSGKKKPQPPAPPPPADKIP